MATAPRRIYCGDNGGSEPASARTIIAKSGVESAEGSRLTSAGLASEAKPHAAPKPIQRRMLPLSAGSIVRINSQVRRKPLSENSQIQLMSQRKKTGNNAHAQAASNAASTAKGAQLQVVNEHGVGRAEDAIHAQDRDARSREYKNQRSGKARTQEMGKPEGRQRCNRFRRHKEQ